MLKPKDLTDADWDRLDSAMDEAHPRPQRPHWEKGLIFGFFAAIGCALTGAGSIPAVAAFALCVGGGYLMDRELNSQRAQVRERVLEQIERERR